MMEFDYNSTRSKLILAEYGRNVQKMVEHICTLETKEERNRYAQVVIDMMGVLNPQLRDISDFKHKLWEHLHIISDYQIDVDSPYPIISKEERRRKPAPMGYPQHRIKIKHYGYMVEKLVEKAIQKPEGESRDQMAIAIANFMKMAYVTWNKDAVQDQQILEDLRELSNGLLDLPPYTQLTTLEFRTPPPGSSRSRTSSPTHKKSGGHHSHRDNHRDNHKKKKKKRKG